MPRMFKLSPAELSDPKVMKAAEEGRVLIVVEDDNESIVKAIVKRLMNYVVNLCEEQISFKTNMAYIHAFLTMLTSENRDDFESSLLSKDKRVKFLCHIAGVLLEVGLLKGSAGDIASHLKYDANGGNRCRRYINEGRHIEAYNETFRRFRDAIPNYPADLCTVVKERVGE